jgi:RHS repeat-associated protein
LVADATGTTVWRWDQAEPFGNNPADEDPDGNSVAFDLPLRLPGQRYDKETALHYNYFRDYDPSIGRYGESDPIGLRGGLNTYAYGDSAPLHSIDLYCLVSWSGWGRSLAYGAYGRNEFELKSECKCGIAVTVKVTVDSLGSKGFYAIRDEAEFEDDFDCPNSMVFAGPALGYCGVAAFRYGVAYCRAQIGRAAMKGGWSAVEGIGGGIGPWAGIADVQVLNVDGCCKESPRGGSK